MNDSGGPIGNDPQNDERQNDWRIIHVKPRVDSFNQEALIADIRNLIALGHSKIGLDLAQTRFFSLPMIKFCAEIARDLASRGGRLALISCPQRTKRHFDIYGSVAHIYFVRSEADLTRGPARPGYEPTL